ncbi:hypothetical protein GCM10009663_51150 [Kitasatospora arboriphila]|uniref:Uncharacterized protein n=1 Tax=Kitasatospora arboriphila TaxID=258052 RepID=A0ABP4EBX7_9ACTN
MAGPVAGRSTRGCTAAAAGARGRRTAGRTRRRGRGGGSHRPAADRAAAAQVFSRFLRHLAYLELAPTTAPLPEMQWFPPTRAAVA